MKTTITLLTGAVALALASCANTDPEYQAYKAEKEKEAQEAAAATANNTIQSVENTPLPGDYSVPTNTGVTGSIDNAPFQPISPPSQLPGGTFTSPPSNHAIYDATPALPTGNTISHTIVAGDSLWRLSKTYNTSIDAIKAANGLTSDTILKGQSLLIPNQ